MEEKGKTSSAYCTERDNRTEKGRRRAERERQRIEIYALNGIARMQALSFVLSVYFCTQVLRKNAFR